MKVLQVLPTLSAGGAESFIANLSIALSRETVDCKIFLTGGVRGQRGRVLQAMLEENGVEVIGVDERPVRSFANIVSLFRTFLSFRPQIVQANLRSSEVISMAALGFLRRNRWRLIRRLANTRLDPIPGGHAVRHCYAKRFDAVIACSPSVAQAYNDVNDNHDLQGRIYTVLNGCAAPDRRFNADEKETARAVLGIASDDFVVVHVGSMGYGKGGLLADGQKAHDIVVRSFAAAFGSMEGNARLVLVGDGPARQEIEALTETLGVRDRVCFLGLQPHPWAALKAADVFFFPSRYEGIPNALLEAACFGVPVVASDIDEIRVLLPKKGWSLCPKDDVRAFGATLRKARENAPDLRSISVENAKIFQEGYSMKACAEQYLGVYRACLGEG